jgi:plastocyanin
MWQQDGFLGTSASFGADLTLIAEILFFVALCLGIVAQRRGQYKVHDWIQTPVVFLNLLLILSLMLPSFMGQRVASTLPQRPGDAYYLVVAVHATLGLVAEALAIYCLLAGFKILPRKIGRLRYWMWATFGFWTAAVVFGAGTYAVWYLGQPAPVAAAPVATDAGETADAAPVQQALLQNFEFVPPELTVVAGTTVSWLNQDGAPHNVTFADDSLASDDFFQGERFETVFDTPGTYAIYCSLHGNADGSGMATVVTVVDASEENVAAVAATAVAAPTPNPAPPTPTPAPAVPPAPVNLIEPAAPAQLVIGIVSFFDDTAASDSVNVSLNGLAVPEPNTEWHAWLSQGDSGQILSLGPIEPDENGNAFLQYTDEAHRNLLGLYDGFQITQEPQFDDDPTPGPVFYSGRTGEAALAAIRTITVQAADTPRQQAYALGARRQTEELLRHVE